MLQLTPPKLTVEALAYLEKSQKKIDGLNTFPEKIGKANELWSNKNNKAFDEIKEKLDLMCSGARRCCYCEDSRASQIEHIFPKNLFPEKTYAWENYLYVCGPCNLEKSNSFAVFEEGTNVEIDVTPPHHKQRPKGYIAKPPIKGKPLFLNPREENPMEYMELDISLTFLFDANEYLNPLDKRRAEYTHDLLLNEDLLAEVRESAFGNYKARLVEYVEQKKNKTSQPALDKLAQGIKKEHHPTVWKEMIRQRNYFPKLKNLFDQAPEAINW